MDCTELKALLDQFEDGVIPRQLKSQIENHLETCRSCRAKLANYIKIGNILTSTVYGEPTEDKYLGFLNHLTGQKFIWGPPGEVKPDSGGRKRIIMMLKVFAGFVVAVGVGVSSLMILSRSGCIGKGPEIEEPTFAKPEEPASPPRAVSPTGIERQTPVQITVAELNRPEQAEVRQPSAPSVAADSSRLRILRAELTALRDAVSRTPRNRQMIRRAMDKYRQLIAERRRLNQPSRVRDYYNLGYMHYLNEEYPQTAIVTGEGIQMVRIGPVEYLHYLKAMSHYRIAEQAAKPLPSDTSTDDSARVAGALLRAELDVEGRRQAINELRRAISEFNYMMKNPELEQTARDWILKCSRMIEQLSESG
jgi:hypothetical protein